MNAIMLHYFHGGGHKKSQGSISADDLAAFIENRGVKNLLNADEWVAKLKKKSLRPSEYCLTFDDNLKSQADVALPVLDHFNKTAFWFVYTSPYTGSTDRIELFRYFRNIFYNDVDEFYDDFFNSAKQTGFGDLIQGGLKNFPEDYLKVYSFYSRADRVFRFVRDRVLGSDKYFALMDSMMISKNIDLTNVNKTLWIDESVLSEMDAKGHYFGLHSHTHPTNMAGLPIQDQLTEYQKNLDHLGRMLSKKIEWVAHPCGSYNSDTLAILSSMGINYGFRSNSSLKEYSTLELPRIDSAELITG